MLFRKPLALTFFFAILTLLSSGQSSAQWRIPTPRAVDTIFARKLEPTISKIPAPPSGTELFLTVSGTYTELGGAAMFDAGYAMKHPGWNVPPPLRTSPPYKYKYNGKDSVFDYGLMYAPIPGGQEKWFVPLEGTYASNHIYTARIPANGIRPNFRISAAKGAAYSQANGFLVVKVERWTAGICVKKSEVDFGSVPVGTSKMLLDSIASYGINPLFIDSIYIAGPNAANFSASAKANKFELRTEQAAEIQITFTPQTPDTSHASLFILCKNSDLGAKPTEIKLIGFGAKPQLGINVDSITFGKVRIGPKYAQIRNAFCTNIGNADLEIRTTVYDQGSADNVFSRFSPKNLPLVVPPPIQGQPSVGGIGTKFEPIRRTSYRGVLHITGNDKSLTDSVILLGEGAEPIPVFDPPSRIVNFDSVYSGDRKPVDLTITNKGNWPITVTDTWFEGTLKAAFSYTPNVSTFVIDPDSSRKLTFWFKANSGEKNYEVKFILRYDNDPFSQDTIFLKSKEITAKTRLCDTLHDFGKVKVGGFKEDTITCVMNVTNVPISFSQREILPSKPFYLVDPVSSISPKSTIQVRGTFNPQVPGPAYAWFFIAAGGRKDSVLLLGEGVIAKGIFNPPVADFNIVPTDTVKTMKVELSDSGSLPLRVIRYEITGPDKDDFKVTQILQDGLSIQVPFTILENTFVDFKVSFTTNAKTGAVHTATLCVYYDDSTSDCIPLQAIEEAQYVQFASSSVDFGKVRVKKDLSKPAQFRNGSNTTLNIGKVDINQIALAFSILDTLAPVEQGKIYNLNVNFRPTDIGNYDGWLVASGRDFKKDSIALRGEGAAPMIDFTGQETIRFGTVKLGIPKIHPASLEVRNLGNWQLNVIDIFIRNDKYGEFDHDIIGGNGTKTTLIVEETDSANVVNGMYDVTFRPTVTSVYHSADLVFLLDDSSEHVVKLIGYDESPNLVLAEDTITFGKVRIGTGIPGTQTASLINTSPDTIKTVNVHLDQSGTQFKASPTGSIVVAPYLPDRKFDINLEFMPTAIGPVYAHLVNDSGPRVTQHTTVLVGIGATPVATFTPPTVLDFSDVLYSTSASRTFKLQNTGNWIFRTIKVAIDPASPNAADFTPSISQIFSIDEDSSKNFSVSFMATTPFQTGDRRATLVFTLDDNSEVRYDLLARDREPFKTDLRFDNIAARIDDIVYPYLRLHNAVPDSLIINSLKGTITYDPAVVNLEQVTLSDALAPLWTLTDAPPQSTPGSYSYSLTSAESYLGKPVAILKLKFRPVNKVPPGTTTTITHSDFSFPGRKEVQAQLTDGVITIDSSCGNTHIISGIANGTFVDQNHPNPFNIAIGSSTIPFDIGGDDVAVTIRILDMTGREVARPVDNQSFKRGRYSVSVDPMKFTSGSYFYEFQAAGKKPQIKKMVIGK